MLLAAHCRPRRPHLPSWMRFGWRQYVGTVRPSYDPADIHPDPLVDMVLAMYTKTDTP